MPVKRPKITVVGAGAVGATVAQYVAAKELGDVVLVDVIQGLPQGKALDLMELNPVEGINSKIVGTNEYAPTAGSDVVVITAGSARKPGMSRDDLVNINSGIVGAVTKEVVKYSPDAVIIVVTNPLDVMCYVALKNSGFPKNRVMGLSGVLDSTRFRLFIAEALGISVEDTSAFVLGGHGDTMVPLVRYSYAGGIPIEKLLPKETIDQIVDRTRKGGGEIVNLLGTSAWYAPGASITTMVKAVLHDEKRILPVAAYLEGEYGQSGIFMGVPAIIGANGVEKIIELDLTPEEKQAFDISAEAVRGPTLKLGL